MSESEPEVFECGNCNRTFDYKHNYLYHIENDVCKKPKRFKCRLCNLSYQHKRSLKRHLLNHHDVNNEDIENCIEIKKYISDRVKCSICGKTFANNSNLNKHLKSCTQKNNGNTNTNKIHKIDKMNAINNTIFNGGTNQLTNNNNNNNYDVKFNINNFGQEDPVEREQMIKLMKRTNVFNIEDLFLKYVFMKHVKNENNRNLFVERKTGGTLFVLCDNVWKKKQKEDTFNLIKIGTIDDIDDFMNKNKEFKSEIIGSELDKLEHQNKKKFYKGVNEMLFNKKELLSLAYKEANKN
jgi:hypothetical protein